MAEDEALRLQEGLPMKVALYARVSTDDKGQEPETQLAPLREYAKTRDWLIYKEYVDVGISGRDESRPDFDRMKADALHRRFDLLLIASLDRLSRAGISHVFRTMEYLWHSNVRVISLQEPHLSTDSDTAPLLLAVYAWVAERVAKDGAKKVRGGVAYAESHGKIIGKHPMDCGCGVAGHDGSRKPVRDASNKVIGWDPPLPRNRRRAAKTPPEESHTPIYKEDTQAKTGVLAGPQAGS